jgi:two-component system, NarL family, nitrate/nitrite response regulator NarL
LLLDIKLGMLDRMPATSRTAVVCLLSAHPLVLQEMHRVLASVPFDIRPTRFKSISGGEESAALPHAQIYIVDSESSPREVQELVRKIIDINPNAQTMVLGEQFTQENAFPLLNLGVKGLVSHSELADQLPRALMAISTGGYWVARNLLAAFVDSITSKARHAKATKGSLDVDISRREKEIIDCLLQNLSNKEIGNQLNISERTVKFHVSNLLAKFAVQRRADLILLWYHKSGTESAFDKRAP